MSFQDDDHATLDMVLGQTHHLLGRDGDTHAQRLVQAGTLHVRRDGGYFNPIPGDNWTDATYEAVLEVDPNLVPEFTPEVIDLWVPETRLTACDLQLPHQPPHSMIHR